MLAARANGLRRRQPGEPEYIRPILLIQAENKDKPANVEAVKQFLLGQ